MSLVDALLKGRSYRAHARDIRVGDMLYVPTVPYARPTGVKVGWYPVLEVTRAKRVPGVINVRIAPSDMTERNDVLSFNEAEVVTINRPHATKALGVVYPDLQE